MSEHGLEYGDSGRSGRFILEGETLVKERRGGIVYVLEPGAGLMSSEKKLNYEERVLTYRCEDGDMIVLSRRVGPGEFEEYGRATGHDGWFRLVLAEPRFVGVDKPGGKFYRVQFDGPRRLTGTQR